jgi:alanine-glyoxylate transaminase/serine-glyoxylate transaminase/serine-pyruvate transaminase
LDPEFLEIMNQIQAMLRLVFQTSNPLTMPISGTGSAGMEAALVNFIEPGDSVLVCEAGVFGQRMTDIAGRVGAKVHVVRSEWGKPIDDDALISAAAQCHPKLISIVHAETSTGVLQPLKTAVDVARNHEALLVVDTVTSLGGHPVAVDVAGIDVCYSGTQKCLSCPPGLAPITVGPRALNVLRSRKSKVLSWYLDLSMVEKYWGADRTYHHTAPISMNYGLHEALRIILEEGLEQRWKRHELNHRALVAGLEAMGLRMLAEPGHRLWSLNAVRVPEGIDEARVRSRLLLEFQIEIGGGLGNLKGLVWRVGLMGFSSSRNNVFLFLSALESCLREQSFKLKPGASLVEADRIYSAAGE